jgi:hypothetical protein
VDQAKDLNAEDDDDSGFFTMFITIGKRQKHSITGNIF